MRYIEIALFFKSFLPNQPERSKREDQDTNIATDLLMVFTSRRMTEAIYFLRMKPGATDSIELSSTLVVGVY